MGSYIRRDVFDAYWFALGYAPNNAMVQWFIVIYSLIPGEIPNGDEPPIPVLFLEPVYWSQLYAFSMTDDFICSTDCRQLRYPN
jgi:hypothetical protein